jgi:hypothetical protein
MSFGRAKRYGVRPDSVVMNLDFFRTKHRIRKIDSTRFEQIGVRNWFAGSTDRANKYRQDRTKTS